MINTILTGDAAQQLQTLTDQSVHCCITSPPYWGLRDYGHAGQLGLEKTPEQFIANLVTVFHEVKRVLRDDGTLWVNMGDTYAHHGSGWQGKNGQRANRRFTADQIPDKIVGDLKPKDLTGQPWMLALALRADGWYLRQDIIWHKPNPMPESTKDRCTKAHEYLFLLSKSPRYYYDAVAIAEPTSGNAANSKMPDGWDTGVGGHGSYHRQGREKGKRTELARGFGGGHISTTQRTRMAKEAIGRQWATSMRLKDLSVTNGLYGPLQHRDSKRLILPPFRRHSFAPVSWLVVRRMV